MRRSLSLLPNRDRNLGNVSQELGIKSDELVARENIRITLASELDSTTLTLESKIDLLEIADCCKARKVHFMYDKREHPRQSLLQPNLGFYSLTFIFLFALDYLFSAPQIIASAEGHAVKVQEAT